MKTNFATMLGLRKKTFFEKVMDWDVKKALLYSALAIGAAYGLRKASPLIGDFIKK